MHRGREIHQRGSVYTLLPTVMLLLSQTPVTPGLEDDLHALLFPHIWHPSFLWSWKGRKKASLPNVYVIFFPQCQWDFLCRHFLHKRVHPPVNYNIRRYPPKAGQKFEVFSFQYRTVSAYLTCLAKEKTAGLQVDWDQVARRKSDFSDP